MQGKVSKIKTTISSSSKYSSFKYNKGAYYFEVLVALAIVAIGLISFFKYQLIVVAEDDAVYLRSVAEVQIEAMIERLHANRFCVVCEVSRWNDSNNRVLPGATGRVSGTNPYRIELMWEETGGRVTQIVKEVNI